MGFRTAYLLPIVAAIAITAGNGQADTIKIDDLAEGVPTVQSITAGGIDNTATNVTIISSSPESIHFLWTSTDATQSDQISIDMLETDGTVSDRILITGNGTSIIDFLFASDPVAFPSQINPLPSVIEDGTFQTVGQTIDTLQVRSDLDAVPEPATLTPLGIGIAAMAGYRWRWRQKQARKL
jgi:hypothetical protein